jgi:hypothetical protein
MPHYSEFLIEKKDTTGKPHYSEFLIGEKKRKKPFLSRFGEKDWWTKEPGFREWIYNLARSTPPTVAQFLQGSTSPLRQGMEAAKRAAELERERATTEVMAPQELKDWKRTRPYEAAEQIPFLGLIPRSIREPKATWYDYPAPAVAEAAMILAPFLRGKRVPTRRPIPEPRPGYPEPPPVRRPGVMPEFEPVPEKGITAPPIRLGEGEYGGAIVHRSARKPNKVQVTRFTEEGKPKGHDEYASWGEALAENAEMVNHPVFKLRSNNLRTGIRAWEEATFEHPQKEQLIKSKYVYVSPLRPLSGVAVEGQTGINKTGTIGILYREKPLPLKTQESLDLYPFSKAAIRAGTNEIIKPTPSPPGRAELDMAKALREKLTRKETALQKLEELAPKTKVKHQTKRQLKREIGLLEGDLIRTEEALLREKGVTEKAAIEPGMKPLTRGEIRYLNTMSRTGGIPADVTTQSGKYTFRSGEIPTKKTDAYLRSRGMRDLEVAKPAAKAKEPIDHGIREGISGKLIAIGDARTTLVRHSQWQKARENLVLEQLSPREVENALKRKVPVLSKQELLTELKAEKAEYPELGKGKVEYLHGGPPVTEAFTDIARMTNELIQKAKAPPEIRGGVKEAKQAMIEHDRQIRGAEWTSKSLTKVIEDVVPDKARQMEMVHAYEQKMKGPHWENLTDLEKSMVGWIAKEKAKLNQFIREHDILETMPESEGISHIFHHWINPETGQPFKSMYGKFSKGLPQAKQRVIPTYEVGIEKGFKPATTNIGKLVGMEWEAATRAHQSRAMFKTLHQIGAEKDVNIQLVPGKSPKPIRMVERWDLLEKQGLAEDYTRYSHYALDKAITFKDVNGNLVRLKGPVGVRNELFPFVKAYLENPSYAAFSRLNFAAKSLVLGFSVFHIMSLGMQEAANWRVPFSNIPRGLKAIRTMNPQLRILHQEGLDLFKGYEDIGYRNRFFEGTNQWSRMGNLVTKPIEGMRSFIFDIVQPGMKASFALDKYNKLLPKYLKKGFTKEECARRVVKAADGHFSHEHWKRSLLETNRFVVKLYFMPAARKFWQTLLLAPTWQREHMLVAKDVVKSFMPDKWIKRLGMEEMGPIKAEYRKYALGGTMLIGAADLYNLMATQQMDGKARHIWQNPSVFSVRALWNRPDYTITTKDGQERTIKGGPAYFRPFKSIYEVAEWVSDPAQKFIYKVSPFLAGVGHQMWPGRYQKEYKGWKDIPERTWNFITDVGTPISWAHVAGYMKGQKEIPDIVLPFFGMPTSKLSGKAFNDFYYGRMATIEKEHGQNAEWWALRDQIEKFGREFNWTTYEKYK